MSCVDSSLWCSGCDSSLRNFGVVSESVYIVLGKHVLGVLYVAFCILTVAIVSHEQFGNEGSSC